MIHPQSNVSTNNFFISFTSKNYFNISSYFLISKSYFFPNFLIHFTIKNYFKINYFLHFSKKQTILMSILPLEATLPTDIRDWPTFMTYYTNAFVHF